MVINCDCISAQTSVERSHDFCAFEELRRNCTALRNVLIPEEYWASYKNFCLANRDEAQHQPVLWLAYRRGYLAKFTGPVHNFIIEGKPRSNTVTNQYYKDLAERWYMKKDFFERYKISRMFQGRLAELRFAMWLHQTGWKIVCLEAYGGMFDVEAQSPEGAQTVFEVKYFAKEESRFRLGVEALDNDVSSGWVSLYSQIDYLLCRTYEAAQQLKGADQARVAALVLADYSTVKLQLEYGWIRWDGPSLYRRDQDIEQFLVKFSRKYPKFEEQMDSWFRSLNQIWILEDSHDFGLERKFCINPVTGEQA